MNKIITIGREHGSGGREIGKRIAAKLGIECYDGRLVAEADRQIVPETVIRRTVQYGFAHYPELDREGHWQRTCEHLKEKYEEGGYLRLWIPQSPNAARLAELRALIKDRARLRALFDGFYERERADGPSPV